MKKKALLLVNKIQAMGLIWKSKSWLVSANDPQSDRTLIMHSDMPVKSLQTTVGYITAAVSLEQARMDIHDELQADANVETLRKVADTLVMRNR